MNEDPCEHSETSEETEAPARTYAGMPLAFIAGDPPIPAPFLMSRDEAIRFLRLNDSRTKFPASAIQRYRKMGLQTVRIGRCVWFRLDDVLRFLDDQQARAMHRWGH
jgi:hypothetical protein